MKSVDQLVDHPGDVRLEHIHPTRGEDRVEQAPVLPMLGRIDLQRYQGNRLAEVDRIHTRGELLGMGERVLDGAPLDDLGTVRALDHGSAGPGPAIERLGLGRDRRIHESLCQIAVVHVGPLRSGLATGHPENQLFSRRLS